MDKIVKIGQYIYIYVTTTITPVYRTVEKKLDDESSDPVFFVSALWLS